MDSILQIAVHGAAGRMGQRLVALIGASRDLKLAAAIESAQHPRLGQDAGVVAGVGPLGVPIGSELASPADVVIDFSVPEALEAISAACVARRVPLVVATTGLRPEQVERLQEASRQVAVLRSPNMSLAVNLCMKLACAAAAALKDHPGGADVEIIERHHRYKEDAPSGTALRFGELISGIMGQGQAVHGRYGRPGPRAHTEIGYHAVRAGDNPGEHAIVFGLLGESLELVVRATSRDAYAHGALAAARFLAHKPPGMYSMDDVLGL
jgi:4-hydroxy-tetrahydrodipicolinate reductase